MSHYSSSQENTIDQNILDEFVSEYNSSQIIIESLLQKLEVDPQNNELLNSLFREVHTIKGNAHLIGLTAIANFVHTLETTLDKVRKKEITFDSSLSDAVLESIDLISDMCKNLDHPRSDHEDIILTIEAKLQYLNDKSESAANIQNTLDNRHKIFEEINTEQINDLKFFSNIVQITEQRTSFWKGRSQRLLNIALEINSQAGQPVDSAQLEASVYLHDIGMAFLSSDIINENKFLSEREHQIIKTHPNTGATLLGENPIWKEAAMIILQHHEREDGKGYPNGLRSEQICNGAKILAIADTFETLTNHRENSSIKYPVTHAIADINSNAGTQFSTFWVSVFNDVIRKKTTKT